MGPYLRALRSHWKLVAIVVVVTGLATAFHLTRRTQTYTATASMLVTPVDQTDTALLGLPFVRDSGEPTRTIQTAATLVDSPQAAALTAQRLGPGWTAGRVHAAVDVTPQGQSDILNIVAHDPVAVQAARIANTYVGAVLDSRKIVLARLLPGAIAAAQAQLKGLPASSPLAATLSDKISQLQGIQKSGDPSLAASERASVPTSPDGLPSWAIMFIVLLAALALSLGAALLIEFVLPDRVSDEETLLRLYPLPILARVPALPRRQRRRSHQPMPNLPPAAAEAYRTLVAQLEVRGDDRRTLLVTSASSGDGKTTTAVSIARSIVDSGRDVILIDLDLRKPDLAEALSVAPGPERPLNDPTASLDDMLIQVPGVEGLSLARPDSAHLADLSVVADRLPQLLERGRELAEFIVMDSAPLGEVSDPLRFAAAADDVVVVVRPGKTLRNPFEALRTMLSQVARPAGFVVLGSRAAIHSSYYYAS